MLYFTLSLCIITIVSFIININYYDIKKCINENNLYDRSKIYGNIFIHNLITCFLFVSLFSFDIKIITMNIILSSIIIIHWQTNNNKCMITLDLNKRCNLDVNEKHRDIFYMIRNINNKKSEKIEEEEKTEEEETEEEEKEEEKGGYIFMIFYIVVSVSKILYIKRNNIRKMIKI